MTVLESNAGWKVPQRTIVCDKEHGTPGYCSICKDRHVNQASSELLGLFAFFLVRFCELTVKLL